MEKVVVEAYRLSAKGEEIGEWYETLLSKHGVSYEGRQGGFGWHASAGRLRMVFHPLAPAALDPLSEGRVEANAERDNNPPFPHPDIVAGLCEPLIGSVSTRGRAAASRPSSGAGTGGGRSRPTT